MRKTTALQSRSYSLHTTMDVAKAWTRELSWARAGGKTHQLVVCLEAKGY